MDNVVGIEAVKAQQIQAGKRIILGAPYKTIEFPDGTVVDIKRMGMNSELQFIDLYNSFVVAVKDNQTKIMGFVQSFAGGSSNVSFGLVEGMALVGDILGGLPALQAVLVDAVQVILRARSVERTNEWIVNNLGTADLIEVISAQGEAQGLLGLFRGLTQGLDTQSK
jgi:hypothetical protein